MSTSRVVPPLPGPWGFLLCPVSLYKRPVVNHCHIVCGDLSFWLCVAHSALSAALGAKLLPLVPSLTIFTSLGCFSIAIQLLPPEQFTERASWPVSNPLGPWALAQRCPFTRSGMIGIG